MSEREKFALNLTCAHCQAVGFVIWEENRLVHERGPRRKLVSIVGQFHPENGRTNSGDPLIVCDMCDQIQPD